LRSIVNQQPSTLPDQQASGHEALDLGTLSNMATDSDRTRRPAGFDSVGRSALDHSWLVSLIVVLALVMGIGAGYKHPVSYVGDARLIVGRTSGLATDEVPGLAAAVQGLAEDYARLITSSTLVKATEANLKMSHLPGALDATALPDSSIIDLQATASNEVTAVTLANAAAAALVTVVVAVTNDGINQLKPILTEYHKAESVFDKATVEVAILQNQLDSLETKIGSGPPTAGDSAAEQTLESALADWQTQASTAQLQASAYSNQYNQALPPLQAQQEMVQQVGIATYSSNNRKPYIEAGGLAGVVVGLIVGLAFASYLDARAERRPRARRATQ
jgi:capsular polysaccharide biosynthesis protein